MPLGWHISVYRQQDGGSAPATFGIKHGARLAAWQTGIDGLSWLDALTRQQSAVNLGGNGYPFEYTAQARHIIPHLRGEPPEAKAVWSVDAGDIVTDGWCGKTTKDAQTIHSCHPDEWLLIQAWDES